MDTTDTLQDPALRHPDGPCPVHPPYPMDTPQPRWLHSVRGFCLLNGQVSGFQRWSQLRPLGSHGGVCSLLPPQLFRDLGISRAPNLPTCRLTLSRPVSYPALLSCLQQAYIC